MPKIVHVVNSYFAATYFIGEQFQYFRSKGYEMHLICPPSPFLQEYSSKMGFIIKEVTITRKYTPFIDLIAFFKIFIYLIRVRPDITVGHTIKGGLLTMPAAYLAAISNRIYFRHGLVMETSKGLGRWLLIISERIASRFSIVTVCVSKSVFDESLKHKLSKRNKQIVLGAGTCGGIDALKRFNPELLDNSEVKALRDKLEIMPDDYVIGYCGRIVKDKGVEELVNAMATIQKFRPELSLKLLLVGMFEERDAVSDEIKHRIINDESIIFTGFINDNIQNYYALMNLFVLPSYREGFGMSVIEASSMGIPLITTKSTGCRDSIVENVTGLYTEINPKSIAKAILSIHDNREHGITLGKNGRRFVLDNFQHEIIWKEIEKLYD